MVTFRDFQPRDIFVCFNEGLTWSAVEKIRPTAYLPIKGGINCNKLFFLCLNYMNVLKKSKLLNSCALKYIDELNFVAFRSVRLQQGKLPLKKKKQERERTFSKTVLRINGQRFLFKMFLRNLAVNLWREICGKHFGKVCKKDYNWKSRFGCPFSPTYLNLRACKATIFRQENMPIPV